MFLETAIKLVKEGFINGSVYQCQTEEEYIAIKKSLLRCGWEHVVNLGSMDVFKYFKKGEIYWYSLII